MILEAIYVSDMQGSVYTTSIIHYFLRREKNHKSKKKSSVHGLRPHKFNQWKNVSLKVTSTFSKYPTVPHNCVFPFNTHMRVYYRKGTK